MLVFLRSNTFSEPFSFNFDLCAATLFLEFWKRRQYKLNYEWDLVRYNEQNSLIRPEFEAKVTRERVNPVTKKNEPYLSPTDNVKRMAFSSISVFFWVSF